MLNENQRWVGDVLMQTLVDSPGRKSEAKMRTEKEVYWLVSSVLILTGLHCCPCDVLQCLNYQVVTLHKHKKNLLPSPWLNFLPLPPSLLTIVFASGLIQNELGRLLPLPLQQFLQALGRRLNHYPAHTNTHVPPNQLTIFIDYHELPVGTLLQGVV